jgi:RNA polymerase sigma-70 factor (ECF subfamily)
VPYHLQDIDISGMSGQRSTPDATQTVELLARARAGDDSALEQLFDRHIPLLRRWARGRLPRWARDITDTSDLVQETVVATFRRLESFEPRGDGALQAYLRQALINRVRNELRRASTQPAGTELQSGIHDEKPSPLEQAIGVQTLDRYEAALARLKQEDRDAIVSRVEFGMTFDEVARALGKATPDAARMAVVRALERLAAEMARSR